MSAENTNEATGLHPTARPAEKRQDISFPAKDVGLRQDVHDLGTIIGELLKEQGGSRLFERVEQARQSAIARREGNPEGGTGLDSLIQGLDTDDAPDFIRAFSTYFQMVNNAEQVHRLRRRRDYLRDTNTPQPGSIEDMVYRLRDAGRSLDDVMDLLETLRVEPVFTAHPTEPTRRTILRKQQIIVRRLIDSQNSILTPRERSACFQTIRDNITAIWQTEEHPQGTRTSFDEQEHVLFFMTDVIYRAIPALYEATAEALCRAYELDPEDVRLPELVRFASWIGGDMHARRETTARTIRETLMRQRALILDLYYNECSGLVEKLSQSLHRVSVDPQLLERSEEYSGHFPQAAGITPLRHKDMPYRVFLRLVMQRLQATYDDDAFPYESPDELLDDLRLVARSLENNRGRHAGLFPVQRLIRRVETFGFHFMTLDIRQSALVNRGVVGRCLSEESWEDRTPEYRAERIHRALENNESPADHLDNETKRDLAIFQAIAFCRRKFGTRAIGPYVVSMAHGVDDVLSVILLGRWGGLEKRDGEVPLDIAPYFETGEDLAGCGETMAALLRDPIYREHVVRRGNRQTVMVSYSDSKQDGGLAPARWALHRAQADLAHVLSDVGVELTLFHGRGGTISRGGGKTHAAVIGAPPGSVQGHLRATEQGELVNAKYGLRGIALRTLEQAIASVGLATALPLRQPPDQLTAWQDIMDIIGDTCRRRYQELVYDSEGFQDYFRLATPVDAIELMHAREHELDSDAPDRIPWDFAWTQSRHVLPGWYGSGSALALAVERFGLEEVQAMNQGWPFFRALLWDLENVLAKADLGIAARYSKLSGELHERFFARMRTEFDLCVEKVLQIKEQQVLLEQQGNLRRSIRLRNPYVDPMSLLQIELLRRWRASGRENETLFTALIASINGIARGLQDSG